VHLSQSPDIYLILQAAAAAFAAARLLYFGLGRRFPALLSYLALTVLSSSLFSTLSVRSHAYFLAYTVWLPISWCVAALAVREMFALIFRNYPGLRTVGRWAVYSALAISAAALLLLAREFRPGAAKVRVLLYDAVLDRSVALSLAIVISILMLFLSRYPLDLDRNALVASGCFSALFVAQAAAKLIDFVSPHLFADQVDYAEVVFSALCLAVWGLMLQAASAPATARSKVHNPRETELLQQLASLNAILSGSVRG
jgi:hypothetical protein